MPSTVLVVPIDKAAPKGRLILPTDNVAVKTMTPKNN